MNKEELKQYIDDNIYENQDGEITAEALNDVLKAIVDDGGTEVEANPEGEAAEILEKIGIAGIVYTAPQGPAGQDGRNGTDGVSPTVAVTEITGGWRIVITDAQGPHTFDVMNGQDGRDGTDGTDGTNGVTPHIGANGNWYIGDQDTGVQAEGQDGTNGTNGTDGITPTINPDNNHWMIGETDTGIVAEGQNGQNGANGRDAVNPFKGLFVTTSDPNIPATGQAGDYIFIADANPATTIDLYYWNTAATPSPTWADTGFDIDPSTLAEFANGPAVSMVHIVNDLKTGGVNDVLSAEQGKFIGNLLPSESFSLDSMVTFSQKTDVVIENGIASKVVSNNANKSCCEIAIGEGFFVDLSFVASNHSVNLKGVIVADENYNVLASYDAPQSYAITDYSFITPVGTACLLLNVYAYNLTNAQVSGSAIKYNKAAAEVSLEEGLASKAGKEDVLMKVDIEHSNGTSNLFNPEQIQANVSKDVNTGENVVYNKSFLFGPLKIEEGEYYIFSPKAGSDQRQIRGLFFYDKDGTFMPSPISWEVANSGSGYVSRFTAPQNAGYVYLRFYVNETDVEVVKSLFSDLSLHTWGYEYEEYKEINTLGDDIVVKGILNIDRLQGQTFAVIGDSVETKVGFNTPEILITAEDVGVQLSSYVSSVDIDDGLTLAGVTYDSSYVNSEITFTPTADDIGKSVGKALNHGQADATDRWWQMLERRLGMVGINASWSGSTIGGDANKMTTSWHDTIIRRCGIRTPGTMTRTAPDYIFICRGINDFSLEHLGASTVLTDGFFDNWNFVVPENDIVQTNKHGLKEAYSILIQKLRNAYPTAKIICCTIKNFKRSTNLYPQTYYPPVNGYYSLPQYNDAIREVATYFGCPICEFNQAYPFEELSFYTSDSTHSNEYGHRAVYEKALSCLCNNMKFDGKY